MEAAAELSERFGSGRLRATISQNLVFVGFSATQRPLTAMIESMAGLDDAPPDALTRYTTALTGAYYFVPSTEALRRLAPAEED